MRQGIRAQIPRNNWPETNVGASASSRCRAALDCAINLKPSVMPHPRHGYCYTAGTTPFYDGQPRERARCPRPPNYPEPPVRRGIPRSSRTAAGYRAHLRPVQSGVSQLSQSYSLLEARVSELKGELAVVSAQRIDELSEKERLANRLQNLLDLLPGGVIVIDGQGLVREANPAACQLLGEPLLGQLWRQVIARSFAPRKDDAMTSRCPSPPVPWTPSLASWCCSTT